MDARKKILWIMITVMLLLVMGFILLIAADMYYHGKYLNKAGLNYRGYRGPVLGKKEPGEIRIAMLGSSIVFGYGLKYYEALPAQLEKKLQPYYNGKITVINLAYNDEGVYAFHHNLSDFLYLDYDYAIFYSGEVDLKAGKISVYRHSNPIFRTFGYMPILPLIVKEKMMMMRNGGDLEKAYRQQRVVFRPGEGGESVKEAFKKVLDDKEGTDSIIERLNSIKGLDFNAETLKTDEWAWYKYYSLKAIDFVLQHKKKAIVISPPVYNERNKEQQAALKAVLPKDVFYINLSESAPLKKADLYYDGAHLKANGAEIMAQVIADEVGPYIVKKAGKGN